MILNRIKNCDLSEDDKLNLNLILDSGDIEFVQNYLKEIEMKSTAAKNLPTMEICKLYEQGWSVKAIADKYNCSTNSITKHLAKGGYCWDAHEAKWIKKGRHAVSNQSSMNMLRKNKQADVVTWLLNGGYTQKTITTDIVANKFGCTCDQASGYLTGISDKGILGMKRIGRKLYQFNPVLPSGTEPEVAVAPEPVKHSVPCVEPEVKDINIESFEAVLNFADNVGGLDNLVRIAQGLIKLKFK